MTATTVKTPARRGDLAIVESYSRVTTSAGSYGRARYEVCEVTNIFRDGRVKAVRTLRGTVLPLTWWLRFQRVRIVPRTDIDVAGALDAARSHHYHGHPDSPKPFDDLAAVRDALRPHLTN